MGQQVRNAEHPENNVLQTFLTGLREGLEAALVVSILMSFMVRSGHRDRIPALWTGVTVAVVLSFGFGALLHYTSASMSFEAQEAFGGILSIVAVVFVTWMVFWMKRASRTLKGELHDKMSAAIEIGTIGVFTAALLAVGREGLETALFLYPTFQAQGAGAGPAIGALLGILTSVVIGVLLYRGVVSMNLAVFFKVTGVAADRDRGRRARLRRPRPAGGGHPAGNRQPRLGRRRLGDHQLVRRTAEGHLQPRATDDGARDRRLPRLPRPHDGAVPSPVGLRPHRTCHARSRTRRTVGEPAR